MAEEAASRKELLVRHGLAETVLESLAQALKQFDEAVEHATDGRRAHVGASAELDTVAEEVVHVVKAMDGLNRLRFANRPELLAAWASASNVVRTPQSTGDMPVSEETPRAAGDVRPAA